MMFGFVAKHREIWPVALICETLGVSRSGFFAWLTREPSNRPRRDEDLTQRIRRSFVDSDRTYGARRVWHDVLAAGISCGLHAVERLMLLSRSGNVWDNAAMESFFSSLKTERTAGKVYRSRAAAKADVIDYIEQFYNPRRRHSTLGYVGPMDFEKQTRLA